MHGAYSDATVHEALGEAPVVSPAGGVCCGWSGPTVGSGEADDEECRRSWGSRHHPDEQAVHSVLLRRCRQGPSGGGKEVCLPIVHRSIMTYMGHPAARPASSP